MHDSPETRATLVFRLRDRDDSVSWSQFVNNYGPMIYRFARSRGLQDADAADVLQDVLRSVGTSIGRLDYAKEKGGFRAWLFTITRNRLHDFLGSQARRFEASGGSSPENRFEQLSDRHENLDGEWEKEIRQQLVERAMKSIEADFEPATWKAFWLTSVDGRSAAEVSALTRLSTGAVYVAKSRVLARLRRKVEQFEKEEA